MNIRPGNQKTGGLKSCPIEKPPEPPKGQIKMNDKDLIEKSNLQDNQCVSNSEIEDYKRAFREMADAYSLVVKENDELQKQLKQYQPVKIDPDNESTWPDVPDGTDILGYVDPDDNTREYKGWRLITVFQRNFLGYITHYQLLPPKPEEQK